MTEDCAGIGTSRGFTSPICSFISCSDVCVEEPKQSKSTIINLSTILQI